MSAVLKRIRCGLFSASISCFVQTALQSQRHLDTQVEITGAPEILSRVMEKKNLESNGYLDSRGLNYDHRLRQILQLLS